MPEPEQVESSSQPTTLGLTDRRVLFQYLDDKGHPHFEFTTVLSRDDSHAGATITHMHQRDIGFVIVQIVDSNGGGTGYTAEQSAAAIAEYASRVNDAGERVD